VSTYGTACSNLNSCHTHKIAATIIAILVVPPIAAPSYCRSANPPTCRNSQFHPDFPPKEIIDQDYVRGLGFAKVPELYPEMYLPSGARTENSREPARAG
jgi:hypothetical protein